MLPYYAARFPTVEINYTFYRMPTEKLVERLGGAARPSPFKLTLKAPRRITHDSRLQRLRRPRRGSFCEIGGDARRQAGRAAVSAAAEPEEGPRAVRRVPRRRCRRGRAAAFEFRHASWLDDEVYDAAARAQPGALRRRQREAVDAGRVTADYALLPAARRGLHAGRHRSGGPRRSRETTAAAATCSSTSSTKTQGRGRSSRGC